MANRKISDLTALTAPVTGDLLPIVDISEAAAADKNKKITYGTFLSSVPLGTAAAPSIAFTGDTNTGIYSPGADQLAIATGGTGRVFVTSAGNVGIGTTNSTVPLTVTLPSVAGEVMRLVNEGNPGRLHFYTNTTSEVQSQNSNLGLNAFDVYPITFLTNNLERARIDSSGRLLVGGSLDSGGALLQVFGDRIRVGTAKTPSSAGDTGTAGEICWDANYIYVCTATNTWKRTAIATW